MHGEREAPGFGQQRHDRFRRPHGRRVIPRRNAALVGPLPFPDQVGEQCLRSRGEDALPKPARLVGRQREGARDLVGEVFGRRREGRMPRTQAPTGQLIRRAIQVARRPSGGAQSDLIRRHGPAENAVTGQARPIDGGGKNLDCGPATRPMRPSVSPAFRSASTNRRSRTWTQRSRASPLSPLSSPARKIQGTKRKYRARV